MSTRIFPQLADKYAAKHIDAWPNWTAEEKYDGHRVFIRVGKTVTAYTRPRNGVMPKRKLSSRLLQQLAFLPPGLYDGELMAGDTCTDVKRIDLAEDLRLALFDVIELKHENVSDKPRHVRRDLLEDAFHRLFVNSTGNVWMAKVYGPLRDEAHLQTTFKTLTKRGCEGLILKHRDAPYTSGRGRAWLKMKKWETALLTVTHFEAGKGTKVNRGPYAIIHLRDTRGNCTHVKTLDDAQLARFAKRARKRGHLDIGRRLWIEFQKRTRGGGYFHPHWDRWEDE